jgi:hypothetical protein
MRIRWFGQSTFLISGERMVFIDPFGDMDVLAGRGLRFDYPPIEGVEADLLLVTHEHVDHNAVEVIGGSPVILRSTAGTFESPVGEVIAVASEHDEVAGTERGPNTIFRFTLDGLRLSTSATSASPSYAPSNARRSAISTCSYFRWAPVRPSAASQPQRSCAR